MSDINLDKDGKIVTTEVRKIFQGQCDTLMDMEHRNILVSHFGTFSQELVMGLSQGVEDLLVSIGDKKLIIKRMFSILIEGLQNIRIHGEREKITDRQLSYLVLAGDQRSYKLIMANIIKSEEVSRVTGFIDKINGYSEDELKDIYTSVLSNEFLSQKGGAGLGFITTRMKSGKSLGYDFFQLNDEQSLFSLEVELDK